MRQDHFPAGWEVCVNQFLELFHRYGYIYKPMAGGSWYSANEKWKLTDSEILKAIAGVHSQFVGTRTGKLTRFAVLDIDKGSKYHSGKMLTKLLKVLTEAGLEKSCLYRSSCSGGWHLYLFFEENVASFEIRRQLIKILTLNDFQIAKGQLELFPNPGNDHSLGLGLRLPLQPGWAWLNKETLEVEYERSDLSATKALELFIDDFENDANAPTSLRRLKAYIQEIEERRARALVLARNTTGSNIVPIRGRGNTPANGEFIDFVQTVFRRLPPGIMVDNWYKGRLFHLNGLTGPSQRAEAIECLGHYFFYGDPSRDLPALGYGYEKEREWTITEFLKTRNNGQSKDIEKGRADALNQASRAANWRPHKRNTTESKKYSSKRPISWIRENANRKLDARKRITQALATLRKRQHSFTTVELQEAAGCSRATLYRHADIWRNDYEDLASGFFAICTHEYNGVVGAACSKSEPLSALPQTNMPPGRLAARRISYEIAKRAKRDISQNHKAVTTSKHDTEKAWRINVAQLTDGNPLALPVERIKTLLVALGGYLSVAPSKDEEEILAANMAALRDELNKRTQGPQLPH